MDNVACAVIGFLVGAVVVASLRENESICCKRVAVGVGDRVEGYLGGWGRWLYEESGLDNIAPALLDAAGVDP